MTTPATDPPTLVMSVTETLALNFVATNDLDVAAGELPTLVTSTLVDITTGEEIELAAEPTVTGPLIVQKIAGPTELPAPGNRCRLTINFTGSVTANIWAMDLVIISVS